MIITNKSVYVVCRGGLKVATGVGAVYATMTQGVWSSGDSGEEAFVKVQKKVLPEANTYVEQVYNVILNSSMTDKHEAIKTIETIKE